MKLMRTMEFDTWLPLPAQRHAGMCRRKADREDVNEVPDHNPVHAGETDDEACLLQLMNGLQCYAREWNVQPGCEVQVDLRHVMAVTLSRLAPRH